MTNYLLKLSFDSVSDIFIILFNSGFKWQKINYILNEEYGSPTAKGLTVARCTRKPDSTEPS